LKETALEATQEYRKMTYQTCIEEAKLDLMNFKEKCSKVTIFYSKMASPMNSHLMIIKILFHMELTVLLNYGKS